MAVIIEAVIIEADRKIQNSIGNEPFLPADMKQLLSYTTYECSCSEALTHKIVRRLTIKHGETERFITSLYKRFLWLLRTVHGA